MRTSANVIVNGKVSFSKVAENLKLLLSSESPLVVITAFSTESVIECLKNSGFVKESEKEVELVDRFKEFSKESIDECKRVLIIKMPSNKFKSIDGAYNAVLDINEKSKFAKFLHFFSDDLMFEKDITEYPNGIYERYMDEFGESFIIDCKTNGGNFAFKRISPRFVFSSRFNETPISFFQFEGKDHFIVNTLVCKARFDEKIKRMYMTEYIIRLHELGIVKHLTFYPDPIPNTIVKRDDGIESTTSNQDVITEYIKDEEYIKNDLKRSIRPEASVDPIVNEMTAIMTAKIKNGFENFKERNNVKD